MTSRKLKKECTMKRSIVCLLFRALLAGLPLHADPAFSGSYAATVIHNNAPLTYHITFKGASLCDVNAESIVNGGELSQNAEGTYAYDGTFFRLNAVFRNPRIPAITSVQWVSVVSFISDNSFAILAAPSGGGGNPVRMVFVKEDISFSNDAVARAYDALSQNIPAGSRIAIINIASNAAGEGMFYADELTVLFVNARRYTVVDRASVDVVLAEQNFQTSGYVDDESAVSIGKFLGANVVITGSIHGTGARKRLVLKAINVQTAEIVAMSSAAI
jgi:hypothetical protein